MVCTAASGGHNRHATDKVAMLQLPFPSAACLSCICGSLGKLQHLMVHMEHMHAAGCLSAALRDPACSGTNGMPLKTMVLHAFRKLVAQATLKVA